MKRVSSTSSHLNYIGSKLSLLGELDKSFDKHIVPGVSIVGDLFSGTGIVSHHLHTRHKCPVLSNDKQTYAYTLGVALMSRYTPSQRRLITQKLSQYNELQGVYGYIAHHYAPPARKYFTLANAMKIDAVRQRLQADLKSGNIPLKVFHHLMAALLHACDKVANTASVYAAFLKDFKSSALKPMMLLSPDNGDNGILSDTNYQTCMDALEVPVSSKIDILYLDPPYNTRSYSTYYHMLETITKYDKPPIHGITGIRDDAKSSVFGSRRTTEEAFRALVHKWGHVRVIIVSYSNEGIITMSDMKRLLSAGGTRTVTVRKVPHKRFNTSTKGGNQSSSTTEFIFESMRIRTSQ